MPNVNLAYSRINNADPRFQTAERKIHSRRNVLFVQIIRA